MDAAEHLEGGRGSLLRTTLWDIEELYDDLQGIQWSTWAINWMI